MWHWGYSSQRALKAQYKTRKTGTHKIAKTHVGTIFVPRDLDL